MIRKYIFGIQLAPTHSEANENRIWFPQFQMFGHNRSKREEVSAINSGGGRMKCSHLTGKKVQTCTASRQLYVPSLFELEEFCYTARSTRCPLHVRMTRVDQYIEQDERRDWVPA